MLTLRRQLLLAFLPPMAVVVGLGLAGVFLLLRLGDASRAILRENYDSVDAMIHLQSHLDQLDRTFRDAVDGPAVPSPQYEWSGFDKYLEFERNNITLPGERELVARLSELASEYKRSGDRFFSALPGKDRQRFYQGEPHASRGMKGDAEAIRKEIASIRTLNQQNMEDTSRAAHERAKRSVVWFAGGMSVAVLAAIASSWVLARRITVPVAAVTEAAESIGAGGLHRTVPVFRTDELGRLAVAFNTMSDQVRQFRRSNLHQLLRAQETARAAIDAMPDPVLFLDTEGRVELANHAARHLFGLSSTTDRPSPWSPPPNIREPIQDAIRKFREYHTERFDQAVTISGDGVERSYLPEIRPVRGPDGDTLGVCIVLTDVTRFRVLDQLKGDFVATASHELKTPLTGLQLAVHVLLEEAVGPLTPKQTELLLDARENTQRLQSTVEQLLSLARLEDETAVLKPEPTTVESLLRNLAEAIRPQAADQQIQLHVLIPSDLPKVHVDPSRIAQALENLLTNAVAHTPPGGTITLSAEPATEGFVRLAVSDTGVGIPAEHLPHVFEKFFRVPGDDRPGGTGLGLAIVKETAEAHGGAAAVQSEPGVGSTFSITLPIHPARP